MTKYNLNLDCVSENSDRYKKKHESNYCSQIFSKETSTVSDIHEKLEETKIEPSHINICGLEWTIKQLWVFSGLLLIFLSISLVVVSIFAIATINSYAVTDPTILNNSVLYQQWKGPNATTLIKVYIFNYTNVDEYKKGNANKLHVEEIGPFVYEEFLTKINIKYYPNNTVSYQKQRTHKYRADLSNGSERETVVVPNMFLIGLAAAREHLGFFLRISIKTFLDTWDSKSFLSLPVHKFIWGYDDDTCNLLNNIMPINNKLPCEKNGLLNFRNGTSHDVITVNTGKNNINKVGQIDNYNGQNKLTYWSTEKCNKLQGSDGMLFPPYTIGQKNTVHVYFKELCRSFPMVYEKEVEFLNGKVLAHKYVLPDTVFDLPKSNVENQCFCNTKTRSCAPQGFFNCTVCTFGVPIFVSFPHFYKADADIRNAISGLKLGGQNYESYFNIHPTSGFVMSGDSRLQMNVQVRKSFGMSQLDMFTGDVMLPISWMEVKVETENLLQYAKIEGIDGTVPTTTSTVITFLKIGFLSMAIISLIVIVTVLFVKYRAKIQKPGKQNKEIPSWQETKN